MAISFFHKETGEIADHNFIKTLFDIELFTYEGWDSYTLGVESCV